MAVTRIHGKNASVWIGIANSAAAATAVGGSNSFDLSGVTDNAEVTAFGDTNKIYVAGFPDASGTFSGFFDTTSQMSWTAAQDGAARKIYLYTGAASPGVPDLTAPYWFGTAIIDFKIAVSTQAAVTFSANWKAASPIIKAV